MTSPLGALVDPDLWQRANDVLRSRAGSRPHTKRRANPARAFDGMVFCARCGHKMYGRSDAKPRKDGTKPDVWRYYCIAIVVIDGLVHRLGRPEGLVLVEVAEDGHVDALGMGLQDVASAVGQRVLGPSWTSDESGLARVR